MIFIKLLKVKPASSKKENIYVLFSIIFLILFSSLLLKLNVNKKEIYSINKEQVYNLNLNNNEQYIYTQLGLFAQEFQYIKPMNENLYIETLENLAYTPFYKDSIWETKGKHIWTYLEDNDSYYYKGISQDIDIAGNLLLIINKKDFSYIIKYSKKEDVKDFKEIVSYTGEDYMKNSKGDNNE